MHYAPRTIAFLSEVLHPPLPVDPAPLQRVHNRMFQASAPLYGSFQVTREGVVLSNPARQPNAVSSAAFLADRFQFREELSGLTQEEFCQRVDELTAKVVPERGIQIFTAQVVTVRTLVNPKHFKDSRGFLKQAVFGFGDELATLGREAQLYGMRMVFPPTPDAPCAFTLRTESFASDPRSLFLENQASFGPTIPARGLEPLTENIRATYAFLVERALPFVEHFDVRQEA